MKNSFYLPFLFPKKTLIAWGFSSASERISKRVVNCFRSGDFMECVYPSQGQ